MPPPKDFDARRRFLLRLTPCPGKRLPRDFKKAVALLRRPYLPLTADQYQDVLQVAGKSDCVLFDGWQHTFGDADGGRALMPLKEEI